MRDYTYNGTPVSRMPHEDLLSCLTLGFQINDTDGMPLAVAMEAIRLRLEIEATRRQLGIPVRQPDGSLA